MAEPLETLNRRSERRLPRGRARSLVTLGVFIGLAGFNSGNNIFYLIASSLVAAVLFSKLRGLGYLRVVEVRAVPSSAGVFAHREGAVDLSVTSLRGPLGFFAHHDTWRAGVQGLATVEGARFTVSLRPSRRGREILDGLALWSLAPYGITRQRHSARLCAPLIVFPEPAGGFDLRALLRERSLLEALASHAAPGGGSDFLALRDYRPEDGLRRIHWKSLAKTGQLTSKVMEREEERTLTFILSNRIPADTPEWRERFETVVSRVTAAVVQAHELSIRFRLVTPEAETPSSHGLRHRNRALEILALIQPSVAGAFSPRASRDLNTIPFDAALSDVSDA